jgi:carbon-monoxide dehydrogenase medium subunit
MWQTYFIPTSVDETLRLLAEHRGRARIINGGTDLIIEMERGVRSPSVVIDISRIPDLDTIRLDNGIVHFGSSVTHNQVTASRLLRQVAFPLARASWLVGSPQIRNRGTVAGNLVTASPANDTIAPLWALGASVTLASMRGCRMLPFSKFFLGVRQTALADDEMLVDISFPAMGGDERGTFLKLGLREAQAISVVNVAVVLGFKGKRVAKARIAMGSVAPTIIRARRAEAALEGRMLTELTIERAAELTAKASKPIDDIRGPAWYRREMVRVLTMRALWQLRDGAERRDFPTRPVLLGEHVPPSKAVLTAYRNGEPIHVTVNGKSYTVHGANDKTLLRMLREDIGLTGTKEGCAEGECGACTVWLDSVAVMSCLVPAPRANGCYVTTVEGLQRGEVLHPVQRAFIDQGAVQCGYCTPGFLMAGAKLLEEFPRPTAEQIRQALTGNLCRCTGYYKIVAAIEQAAEET